MSDAQATQAKEGAESSGLGARGTMELAGKVLTTAGILLPVIGTITRAVALVATGLYPISVSAEASVRSLALSGALPTSLVLVTGGVAAWLRWLTNRTEAPDWLFWVAPVAINGGAVAGILFLPGFPMSLVLVAGLYPALYWTLKTSVWQTNVGLFSILPPLLLVLLLGAAYAGVSAVGVDTPKAAFEFTEAASGSRMPSGEYVLVAQTESRLYLMPCSGTPRLVAIPSDRLARATFSTAAEMSAGASLFGFLFLDGEFRLGLTTLC